MQRGGVYIYYVLQYAKNHILKNQKLDDQRQETIDQKPYKHHQPSKDMAYYLIRLPEVPQDVQCIPNPHTIKLAEGDFSVVYIAGTLHVLGIYIYKNDTFVQQKALGKPMQVFYERLPMITDINERTYKFFAKRVREIDAEDFAVFNNEETEEIQ